MCQGLSLDELYFRKRSFSDLTRCCRSARLGGGFQVRRSEALREAKVTLFLPPRPPKPSERPDDTVSTVRDFENEVAALGRDAAEALLARLMDDETGWKLREGARSRFGAREFSLEEAVQTGLDSSDTLAYGAAIAVFAALVPEFEWRLSEGAILFRSR